MINKENVNQFHKNIKEAQETLFIDGKPQIPFFKEYFFITDDKSCDISKLFENHEDHILDYWRCSVHDSGRVKFIIPVGRPNLWKRIKNLFKRCE